MATRTSKIKSPTDKAGSGVKSTRVTKAAPKGTGPSKMVTKPAPKDNAKPAAKPAPRGSGGPDMVVATPDLKKKELIDLVVTRSGIKKKDAKPVVEAMLAVLGETIASGRELNLQPLGKLRINRSTDKGNGQVIICKLRQSRPSGKPDAPAKAPLAGASADL